MAAQNFAFIEGEKIYIGKKNIRGLAESEIVSSEKNRFSFKFPVTNSGQEVPMVQYDKFKCFLWRNGERQFFNSVVVDASTSDKIVSAVMPKEIERSGSRKWDRAKLDVKVVFFPYTSKSGYDVGQTINISGGGMQFTADKRLIRGNKIALAFSVGRKTMAIVAEVKTVELSKDGGYKISVQFFNSEEDQKLIDDYLRSYKYNHR